jgi:hypothetical protein
MEKRYIRPNYSNRLIAGLIDLALIGFVVRALTPGPNMNFLIFLLVFILYRLITIFLQDATLGMKIFKMVFLNADRTILTMKEKIFAGFFILYNGVGYYSEIR